MTGSAVYPGLGARATPTFERTSATQQPQLYYPAFDWLRGILAATVMLSHDRVLAWSHAGAFSVQVFFALSGWLIGGILLRTTAADLPRFYFNRAVRIWVPYYIALALLASASLLRDPVTSKWLEFMTYKVLMVYNRYGPPQLASFHAEMPLKGTGHHFWSVNAEEQFYLLAPVLLVLAARRWGREPLLWAALAVIVTLVYQAYAAIVLGVFAAVLVRRYGDLHLTMAARLLLALVCALSAFSMRTSYSTAAPVCAVSIVLLLAVPGPRSPIGVLIGGLSYPLYLNHWIGVFVANALLGPFALRNSPPRQVLAVILNVAIAAALYWWIDRRLVAKRAELFAERRGLVVTSVAYAMVLAGIAFGTLIAPGAR